MATTFTLLDKTILTGTQSAVEFLSINQNYTDLKLVVSVRSQRSSYADDFKVTINNNNSSTYSNRRLYGSGSSTGSDGGSSTGNANSYSGVLNSNTSTSDTFGSTEFYFPNYAVNGNQKSWQSDGVSENNATNAQMGFTCNLINDTNPITRIKLESYNSPTLDIESSFYLYGIKNS